MKKIAFVVALLVAGAAFAGSPFLEPLPCDYVSHGQFATPGADTLWFDNTGSSTYPTATANLADWYAPMMVPFASDGGSLQMANRRVKMVRFYSRAPFSLKIDHPVGKSPIATYVTVDSTYVDAASGLSTKGNKFPCVFLVQGYPDKIFVKEAGSDTVWFDLGY